MNTTSLIHDLAKTSTEEAIMFVSMKHVRTLNLREGWLPLKYLWHQAKTSTEDAWSGISQRPRLRKRTYAVMVTLAAVLYGFVQLCWPLPKEGGVNCYLHKVAIPAIHLHEHD